jgi:peroxiredoxin Q/BCP
VEHACPPWYATAAMKISARFLPSLRPFTFATIAVCATACQQASPPGATTTDTPIPSVAAVDTAAPAPTAIPAPAATSAAPMASTPPAPAADPTAGDTSDPLVGKPAPDFTAKTHDGKTIHLAALKGKPVVVYFYPADETPGCTKEACSFRDAWKELSATGAVMIGISTDNEASHKKFADHWKLPFKLVSDPKGEIAGKFGVPVQEKYIGRQTFVIGADGNVKKVYRKVNVTEHAAQVTADLKSS